jgi:MarR family transcriptional regulator for hemolysin
MTLAALALGQNLKLAAIRRRNAARLRLGLGDDELTTLLYLRERSRLTQRDLVAFGTLSRSGVGAMVHRLEEAGLIERVPDPDDRRVRWLRLSAEGARELRKACGACEDELERVLAERPADELRELSRLLSALADVTERGLGAPSREPRAAQPEWARWA